MDIRYSYKDVPTVKRFSESNAFVRGLMGPFGSGKSSGCVVETVKRAHEQTPMADGVRRVRCAVIRNSYPQLRDTTVKTFHQWLPPHLFGQWKASEHTYLIQGFEGVELEVMFRALDRPEHVQNLLSLDLTFAWVNEAREVPWAVIQALQGRVGRYPSTREGGCTWFGVFMDTNPPSTDSWWYKLFEEKRPANAEIFKQPSGKSPQAENLPNLPAGYYDNLLSAMDEERTKVYVHGDYGFIIDGRPVYPEYNDNVHVAEVEPVEGVRIRRGWDFGLTPACVFSQMTPGGRWIMFDELTADSMGIDKFSDDVLLHCSEQYPGFKFEDDGDPAGQARSQTDEKTCFQILHSKGINIRAAEQSPAIRIESVKYALRTMVGGKPMFGLHQRCKKLRRGFMGGYQFRKLKSSDERFTEAPDKNEYSHPHDGAQYTATRLFGNRLIDRSDHDEEDAEQDAWIRQSAQARGRSKTGYG